MNNIKYLAGCLCLLMMLPVYAWSDSPGSKSSAPQAARSAAPLEKKLEVRSNGIEQAQGEQLATAIGHFGRARSLLIAAIQAFDTGCKFANPKVLINVESGRGNVMERVEDLERVLAPQARVTKGGVQYQPDNRLIHGAK